MAYQVFNSDTFVGTLRVLGSGRREFYEFTYDSSWIENGFALSPSLPLQNEVFHSPRLFGVLQDISPDRWGRAVQTRVAQRDLTDSEYLLGVNDEFRMGALRIKSNGEFVGSERPPYLTLEELVSASQELEKGNSIPDRMRELLAHGGSLGGARPKAVIRHHGELYLAKFPSIRDSLDNVARRELFMLKLARMAGIETMESFVVETTRGDVLLTKRFDRNGDLRVPYNSAMTWLGGEDGGSYSYAELALALPESERPRLFRRMVFNGLFGNTDDHLRNHGLLYQNGAWQLSPAFDLVPENVPIKQQHHALPFIDKVSLSSVQLFESIREFFNVEKDEFKGIMDDMAKADRHKQAVAKECGVPKGGVNHIGLNTMSFSKKVAHER